MGAVHAGWSEDDSSSTLGVLAGHVLELKFSTMSAAQALLPALAWSSAASSAPATLRIWVIDGRKHRFGLPQAPWSARNIGAHGVITGFNDARYSAVVTAGARVLSLLDLERGEAVFWAADLEAIPVWERAAPLRALLQIWSAAAGLALAHAGAVGRNGRGVLIVGRGGSGKSTTALACLAAGFDYAGDDYVLLSEQPGGGPRAHRIYSTAKLEPGHLQRLPPFFDGAGTQSGRDKIALYLAPEFGSQLAVSLALQAVVLPRVAGGTTRLERCSAGAALLALAPSTLLQAPARDASQFRRLAKLIAPLPAYRLLLGEDIEHIPDRLADVLTHPEA